MKIRVLMLAACVLMYPGTASVLAQGMEPVATATPASAEPRDVSAILETIRAKHDVPSLAAMMVRADGSIVMQGVTGVRQAGSDTKATLDDLFHLGSCTKAMTATLCATLVEEGTLSWDMTLEGAFPDAFAPAEGDKKAAINPAWKNVTLLQLVTHRSGLPTDLKKDGLWSTLWRFKGTPTESRRALLDGVIRYTPQSTPGTKYEYANAGVALAGHMAEVKAGKNYETLMQERLFKPLGITSAGFGAPGKTPPEVDANGAMVIDQPRGHRENGTPVQPGPGADNPAAIAPAGTAHMTLADWSKFVALHLRAARNELRETDPIKAGSVATLHTPFPVGDKPAADEGYAAGWRVVKRPWAAATKEGSRRALSHSGSNTMWYCVVWMSPERDFAVLVVCNRGGNAAGKATDDVAGTLIRELKK